MWFKNLTGFDQISHENMWKNIRIDGTKMISLINDQVFDFGKLEIPTLEELRAIRIDTYNDQIQLSEVIADVKDLHQNIDNKDALFQVAS